jgi:parvulin-like peptidyl-prolyl isomerase
LGTKLAQSLFASQVEPFFMAHQLDFTKAAIYEVFLDDRDLAIELFYALQEQEISFSEVARQYLKDVELRRVGGYRGLLARGQLKPEISAAVFAVTPPQILKPIVTASGVHLILVEEIIQAQLTDELRQEILKQLFSAWIKQQIAQLEILPSTNVPPSTVESHLEQQHPTLR